MARVLIGAGTFSAGVEVGLHRGRTLVRSATVATDGTAEFSGLEAGTQFTVARVDGEGPSVNVTAKDPAAPAGYGRSITAEEVSGRHAKHQAEALASGNQNAPRFIDPRTGRMSRQPG
jgi:hypothetical protein